MDAERDQETWIRTHPEEQDAWGNSVASLRLNLKLTPLERLRKFERNAEFVRNYRGIVNRKKPI